MADPKVKITLTDPTLDTLALFVELADHHSIDGDTEIEVGSPYQAPVWLSIEVGAAMVWMPTIDFMESEDARNG